MKKFPWVSRERLEDTERRLTASDAERLRLLDLLLGGANRVEAIRTAERFVATHPERVDDGIRPVTENTEQSSPASFSTPFDRVLTRFDASHKGGKIPAEFKARMN